MSTQQEEAMRQLDILKQDYQAQLGSRIDEIANMWQRAVTAADPATVLPELLQHVHAIAGTSSVFGLREISCAATALEEALDRQISSGQPDETEILALDHLVKRLLTCTFK